MIEEGGGDASARLWGRAVLIFSIWFHMHYVFRSSRRIFPPAFSLTFVTFACDSMGWPVAGSRPYWRYWNWPWLPSIYDIFRDEDRLVVILNFAFHQYPPAKNPPPHSFFTAMAYADAPWFAELPDGRIVKSLISSNDNRYRTKVLVFPYKATSDRVRRIFPAFPAAYPAVLRKFLVTNRSLDFTDVPF
jgi:hypothetical protein